MFISFDLVILFLDIYLKGRNWKDHLTVLPYNKVIKLHYIKAWITVIKFYYYEDYGTR